MSWVFIAFILSYAIFEIPTARWADKRGAKSVLTRIVTWWSMFTIATAGAFNYVLVAGHALPVRRGRGRRLALRGPGHVALDPEAHARHRQGHLLRRRLCFRRAHHRHRHSAAQLT